MQNILDATGLEPPVCILAAPVLGGIVVLGGQRGAEGAEV